MTLMALVPCFAIARALSPTVELVLRHLRSSRTGRRVAAAVVTAAAAT